MTPVPILENDYVDLTLGSRMKGRNKSKSNANTIEKRYHNLKAKRESFLTRARQSSTYTVPHLYPHTLNENQGDGTNTTGWQSFGAMCVNSLTNSLVLTLFPPHGSFARLELTPKAKGLLTESDVNIIEQEKALAGVERSALLEHERLAGRVGIGEALKHLIVGGTTCLYVPNEGNISNYALDRFVCVHDKSGRLLEVITEDIKAVETFDPAVQMAIKAKLKSKGKTHNMEHQEVSLYTRAYLKGGYFRIEQEVLEEKLAGQYRVKPERNPFIVLRWETNRGEDYGRSLVEQYSGDFHVVQVLSEALAKGMILMSDIKYLIRPGAVTDVDHLVDSPTGEFVFGNIDDIGVLQLEKYADFTPISTVLEKYEQRLAKVFLFASIAQRNAERVTAYEIRRDALEMEKSLGGAYSLLATTLQRPYFRLLLDRVDFQLPEEIVKTVLITGIEALSKMSEADKYFQWTEQVTAAGQLPEGLQSRVKWGELGQHFANQLSLEIPFLMSEEEYQSAQQANQQAMQQQELLQGAVKAAPSILGNMNKG